VNTQQAGKFVGAALTFVCVAVGFGPGSLSGQQSLDVSLTLVTPTPMCSASVDAVDFGTLDAGTTNGIGVGNAQTFNLNFNCTSALAGAMASFDPGLNSSGNQRFLKRATGGTVVRYSVKRVSDDNLIDPNETITFPVPSGSSTLALAAWLSGSLLPTTLGTYTDQVMVTFTF